MPGNLPDTFSGDWPTPNYVDPVQRTWMAPYAIFFTSVSTMMVVVRLSLRLRNEVGAIGVDDVLLVPAWLLSVGFTALAVYSSEDGLIDRHIWDVLPDKIQNDALNAWIGTFVFLVGTCCLKVSVLLFYRRLAQGTYTRVWAVTIWVGIMILIGITFAFVLALVFNCSPTRAYWKAFDPTWDKPYTCTDTAYINVIAGVLSIITDVYSIILPCLMVQKLQMRRQQKIALNFVFALSVVVIGAGCGRTYVFAELSSTSDLTWTGFWTYFWTVMEYNLSIICACAPSLRVFFRRILGSKSAESQEEARIGHMRRRDRRSSRRLRPGSESTLTSLNPPSRGNSRPASRHAPPVPAMPALKGEMQESTREKWDTPTATAAPLSVGKPFDTGLRASAGPTVQDFQEFQLDLINKGRPSYLLGSVRPRSSRPSTPAREFLAALSPTSSTSALIAGKRASEDRTLAESSDRDLQSTISRPVSSAYSRYTPGAAMKSENTEAAPTPLRTPLQILHEDDQVKEVPRPTNWLSALPKPSFLRNRPASSVYSRYTNGATIKPEHADPPPMPLRTAKQMAPPPSTREKDQPTTQYSGMTEVSLQDFTFLEDASVHSKYPSGASRASRMKQVVDTPPPAMPTLPQKHLSGISQKRSSNDTSVYSNYHSGAPDLFQQSEAPRPPSVLPILPEGDVYHQGTSASSLKHVSTWSQTDRSSNASIYSRFSNGISRLRQHSKMASVTSMLLESGLYKDSPATTPKRFSVNPQARSSYFGQLHTPTTPMMPGGEFDSAEATPAPSPLLPTCHSALQESSHFDDAPPIPLEPPRAPPTTPMTNRSSFTGGIVESSVPPVPPTTPMTTRSSFIRGISDPFPFPVPPSTPRSVRDSLTKELPRQSSPPVPRIQRSRLRGESPASLTSRRSIRESMSKELPPLSPQQAFDPWQTLPTIRPPPQPSTSKRRSMRNSVGKGLPALIPEQVSSSDDERSTPPSAQSTTAQRRSLRDSMLKELPPVIPEQIPDEREPTSARQTARRMMSDPMLQKRPSLLPTPSASTPKTFLQDNSAQPSPMLPRFPLPPRSASASGSTSPSHQVSNFHQSSRPASPAAPRSAIGDGSAPPSRHPSVYPGSANGGVSGPPSRRVTLLQRTAPWELEQPSPTIPPHMFLRS